MHRAKFATVMFFAIRAGDADPRVPTHAIAFRTVDQTEVNNQSAPFWGHNSYGGGKLGIYSFWNTYYANNAPIIGGNNTTGVNQYEFYNYSPSQNSNNANPQ